MRGTGPWTVLTVLLSALVLTAVAQGFGRTLAYTLVHVPSLNPMLILAAMVCGIAWGGLYRLFPKQLPAILVSHALWDAAAFVWWPL